MVLLDCTVLSATSVCVRMMKSCNLVYSFSVSRAADRRSGSGRGAEASDLYECRDLYLVFSILNLSAMILPHSVPCDEASRWVVLPVY